MQRPFSDPTQALETVWGYKSFRGQQEDVIRTVLQGRDALVLFPTGKGKSLCFQIPALCLDGLTIVVSPLVALMHDQVEDLKALGVAAACLSSAQSDEQNSEVRRRLHAGDLKLLYVTPERIVLPSFQNMLGRTKVSLICVDECHCVSTWGNNFRKDYLALGTLKTLFPGVPRIALTATADPHTREDIIRLLDLGDAEVFVDSFDRPNIYYEIVERSNGRQQLLEFLGKFEGESGIVYCLSRNKVEETCNWLNEQGFRARYYHARMEPGLKAEVQEAFRMEEGLCLVATVAFGMGINKPNVRYVAHLDLPSSVEGYYQETGRAGRDGLPSSTFMTYSMQDIVQRHRMIEENVESSDETKRIERGKLNALLAICETVGCRRTAILSHFGERYAQPCGNCDTCRNPVEQWDGTDAAIKALAAVYRTGERFGTGHLIDVLVGKVTEKTEKFGHTEFPVFGVGREHSVQTWQSVFRQLLAFDHIGIDHGNFGAVILRESAADVFKKRCQVVFRKDKTRADRRSSKASNTAANSRAGLSDADAVLFERLRKLRLEISKDAGIAPYMVFPDTTLVAFVRERPSNEREMLNIAGVGETKFKRYGDHFLEAIAD
ncbi:DNA helicase RecQ [Rhizobiales bacterium RZME27]|uniref:DNA helicase RecQ n=1 Tax=Endobacterium cereale TaxID=2663029 RepID=A0A6A8A6M7_9HYPH|nr:DNA helicase RecQ [Endobacterium cereale]MEB2846383.1 DNA helicase RecQ [Endobacterium cereale]MQY46324.1 DNA helicase RecQ [Endobacterium cereale]